MLTVKLYNSMTGQKEVFIPRLPHEVGLYVCGMTVYDICHLGHARLMVCFDVIVRFFQHAGFHVNYVRNITDIDDKIIDRAAASGVTVDELTTACITRMHADAKMLGCLQPTHEPRATQSIESMVALIQRLFDLGFAYLNDDGDVCYEVSRFNDYGKLSNKQPEHLIAGARVEVNQSKRSPLDFVLWKPAKPGEPSWPSPWGLGRPGWHIECSAMAMTHLGEQFDVHGGGLDLQFPHHENEIAQSEAITGHTMANYWLHSGLLQLNDEKMSKSTGNFLTIAEVVAHHHPEVLRYFLLSSHYRSPLNYSNDNMAQAFKALTRLYQSIRDVPATGSVDESWLARFNDAMADDFNTPLALAVLFELSHAINKTGDAKLVTTLKHLGSVLGLLTVDALDFLRAGVSTDDYDAIEALIAERRIAKQEANWAQADSIRQQLTEMGIDVEDGPHGSTWRRVR